MRTITVVTGTRAEFGLLRTVMHAMAAHRALTLRTIVTGTHLITDSWRDITAAGFTIDAKAPMQRTGEVGQATDVRALGRGITNLGKALDEQRPDVVVVLGDRIEAFAAASAASVGGIRVAHLHGGDRAEGIADEAMRHAISKLAHLHFPATAQSRRRLIRMGEDGRGIFNVGSPAMDDLRHVVAADDSPEIIVLQHPIGRGDAEEAKAMRGTLAATRSFRRLVLRPNHDPGRAGIVVALTETGVDTVDHLPRDRFLALLKGAKAIVGNSSAGLIEAAALRTACVNIGTRQGGRERAGNVIDGAEGERPVRAALKQALALDLSRLRHPYGKGDTGQRIADILATIDLAQVPLRKRNAY